MYSLTVRCASSLVKVANSACAKGSVCPLLIAPLELTEIPLASKKVFPMVLVAAGPLNPE